MKTIAFTILTLLIICGTVYGSSNKDCIKAIEKEIARLQVNPQIEDYERFWKLNEVLKSLKLQEENKEVLEKWDRIIENVPCDSLDRNTLLYYDCIKVKI